MRSRRLRASRIAVLDSQSVKVSDVAGRAAGVQDGDGAKWVLAQATFDFVRLRIIRADAADGGRLVDWVLEACGPGEHL